MAPLLASHHARGLHVVNDGALAARLTGRNPAALRAYREITGAGEPTGLSLYHVERWLGLCHPYRTCIWVRLRSLARNRRAVRPSLADLAGTLCGLSEEKVRHYLVQFWEEEQPGNLEWEFFRTAVTIERLAGKSYRFLNVVLDDLLHPDDLPELDALTTRLQADDLPATPTRRELRPVGRPHPSEKYAAAFISSQTPLLNKEGPGEVLPLSWADTSDEPDPTRYPDEATVPTLLAELGVQPAGIRRLLRHPSGQGAYWGARWAVWVRAKKDLVQPGGFLFSRILGACEGNPDCREPPLAWVLQRERAQADRRSRERTAAAVAPRPDPFLARKTAPCPDPATAVLPELAEVWQRLRAELALPVRAAFAAATAVTLDGDVLVIELPGISAEALRSRREQLLLVARSVRPELSDLRFMPTNRGAKGSALQPGSLSNSKTSGE